MNNLLATSGVFVPRMVPALRWHQIGPNYRGTWNRHIHNIPGCVLGAEQTVQHMPKGPRACLIGLFGRPAPLLVPQYGIGNWISDRESDYIATHIVYQAKCNHIHRPSGLPG